MDVHELESLLRQTLQDRRLTGGGKRALTDVLAEQAPDEQQLAVLRRKAFELAGEAVGDPEVRKLLDWLEDVVKVLRPRAPAEATFVSEAHFTPEHDCPRRIATLFQQARRRADVCVFTITDDRLADALLDAHKRGVSLRVITDNDKAFDLGSDVRRFEAAGVPLRVDRTPFHMHHKFAVFDDSLVLTGSYNWTRGAARDNKENIVISSERRLIAAFTEAFERLWGELA